MIRKRGSVQDRETKRSAPKYIVSYSAMMTILLAFFIMLNNLASVQEYGLVGAGLGIFRRSFNSYGLPGVLPGSLRARKLTSEGGKFVPEELPDDVKGRPPEERLIEPPEHDLEEVLNALVKVEREVSLPLPLEDSGDLGAAARERLSALARLVRFQGQQIQVQAVWRRTGSPTREEWCRVSARAYRAADYLFRHERIASDRILVVGKVAPPLREEGAREAPAAPEVRLVLRPRLAGSGTAPYGRTPPSPPEEQRTLYRMTQ